jgi:hypothetical protein
MTIAVLLPGNIIVLQCGQETIGHIIVPGQPPSKSPWLCVHLSLDGLAPVLTDTHLFDKFHGHQSLQDDTPPLPIALPNLASS